jgi:hypothetical protein
MKKLFLLGFIIFAGVQLFAQTPATDISKVLKFTNDNYNFGNITYGKPVEFKVDIENISSAPIVLDNVMVGCGCTTPKYEKGTAIQPGAHATVTLGFNGGTMGNFSKNATLFFSGGLTKMILFSGVGVQQ